MIDHFKALTFIPLQLIFGLGVCAAIEVLLQRVHLPAQDVSEGLHLRQLLPQAVALLEENLANVIRLNARHNWKPRHQCRRQRPPQCKQLTLKEDVEVAE